MSEHLFIGIEGGGTHSTVIIIDSNGDQLAHLDNEPPSNHWMLGMEECGNTLYKMISKILQKSGYSNEEKLCGLGLCLSGCEDEKNNEELRQIMMKKLPTVSEIIVKSDTFGPLAAASDSGGIVLIAGTGSNCLLINPDGSNFRCGGWGYMLGDEGSAFWIAHKAIKTCLDDLDNMNKSPYPIAFIWECILEHFSIKDRFGLLEHCYKNFDKSFYSGLTKKIAEGACNGDELCKHLFELNGALLAQHLIALTSNIDSELNKGPFGLPIVCIGSVWLSWEFLSPGFLKTIGIYEGGSKIGKFSLLRLIVPSAFGCALLSAKKFNIPKKFSNYVEVIWESQ